MAVTKVISELQANVLSIEKAVGDVVEVDDPIVILESMKMEIPVLATAAGAIESIMVAAGDTVEEGQAICTIAG